MNNGIELRDYLKTLSIASFVFLFGILLVISTRFDKLGSLMSYLYITVPILIISATWEFQKANYEPDTKEHGRFSYVIMFEVLVYVLMIVLSSYILGGGNFIY